GCETAIGRSRFPTRPGGNRGPKPAPLDNVTSRFVSGWIGVLLLTNSAVAQQIVFSRRVYATQGKSFQQLWIWSADDGMLKPLTHTERDHYRPSCSADGAQLLFESPEFPAPRHRW